MVGLGIFHLIVDGSHLSPGASSRLGHGIIDGRRIAGSVTEVVVTAVLVHPGSFKEIANPHIRRCASKFNHVAFQLYATAYLIRVSQGSRTLGMFKAVKPK